MNNNVVSDILYAASLDIKEYGWVSRGASGCAESDPYGAYPRCPWIATMKVIERYGEVYPSELNANTLHVAEGALMEVTNTETLEEFFALNDSKSAAEGKSWAITILKQAADLLNGAPVRDSETKATDIGSIESQDTGFITNVVNQVKQWLKAVFRVK